MYYCDRQLRQNDEVQMQLVDRFDDAMQEIAGGSAFIHEVQYRCCTWRPYSAHPTATPSSPGPGGTNVFSKPNSLDMRPFRTLEAIVTDSIEVQSETAESNCSRHC